jgi:hypothetical protein
MRTLWGRRHTARFSPLTWPYTPSARVVMSRAAMGQTESHYNIGPGDPVSEGRPCATRTGRRQQSVLRMCPQDGLLLSPCCQFLAYRAGAWHKGHRDNPLFQTQA